MCWPPRFSYREDSNPPPADLCARAMSANFHRLCIHGLSFSLSPKAFWEGWETHPLYKLIKELSLNITNFSEIHQEKLEISQYLCKFLFKKIRIVKDVSILRIFMSPYSPTGWCSIKIPCTPEDKPQKVTVTLTGSLSVLFLLLTCSQGLTRSTRVFGQGVLPPIPSHTSQHLHLNCISVPPVGLGSYPGLVWSPRGSENDHIL